MNEENTISNTYNLKIVGCVGIFTLGMVGIGVGLYYAISSQVAAHHENKQSLVNISSTIIATSAALESFVTTNECLSNNPTMQQLVCSSPGGRTIICRDLVGMAKEMQNELVNYSAIVEQVLNDPHCDNGVYGYIAYVLSLPPRYSLNICPDFQELPDTICSNCTSKMSTLAGLLAIYIRGHMPNNFTNISNSLSIFTYDECFSRSQVCGTEEYGGFIPNCMGYILGQSGEHQQIQIWL